MPNARIKTRRDRRKTPGKYRLRKPRWIDPYPHIAGTEPEKRVFEMLHLMDIYFIFQGQVPEFEKGKPLFFLNQPNYKPDFILPEYRIIIDPFPRSTTRRKSRRRGTPSRSPRSASPGMATTIRGPRPPVCGTGISTGRRWSREGTATASTSSARTYGDGWTRCR